MDTAILNAAQSRYESLKALNMSLDMSRGKPNAEQLALSDPMLGCLSAGECVSAGGVDCRNYGGGLNGIPEIRRIFAEILNVSPDEVVAGNNSSLSLMFDCVANYMSHGVCGGEPWSRQGKVKFVCPCPGYDRHFSICEYFGIEMLAIDMDENGPDMDAAEALIQNDPLVKGMWCVPVYSNPTGCVYSDAVVKRIAALKPKAPDFRLFWDNAYTVHNFRGPRPSIPNILRECERNGSADMPLVFTSFSKVTFASAAVAAMAASEANRLQFLKHASIRTVSPDKLNQLRHARFLGNLDGVLKHMEKMAALVRPRFEAVLTALDTQLAPLRIADWSRPDGGYFVSFNAKDGCAKKIVELCEQAGVKLTKAGATYPYGRDPRDRNIRIAPTYPAIEDLRSAMEVFCASVILASA
jgi:DNA-binding transcriptional MocR family regulator